MDGLKVGMCSDEKWGPEVLLCEGLGRRQLYTDWATGMAAQGSGTCSELLFSQALLNCSSARAANALPAIYLHLAASAKFVIGRTEHQALPYVACLHIDGRSRGASPTTLLVTTRHRLYELYMTQLPACLMRVKSTKDTTFIGQSFRTCATMASSRPRL